MVQNFNVKNYKETKFVNKYTQSQFATLENIGESISNTLKEALVSTAIEVIPKKEKNVKKKWITNEILGLIEK